MVKFRVLIVTFFGVIFLPGVLNASTLYMESSEIEYGPGSSFVVDLKIDDVVECVNTVEAEILFPSEYLNVLEFLNGESILSLWVDEPASSDLSEINKEGRLYFSGGIPGGDCGKIPGDPGDSNLVARVAFGISDFASENKIQDIEIGFGEKTSVFMNDGFGTLDEVKKEDIGLKINNDLPASESNWENFISDDLIQPEPFVVELHKNPSIYSGLYHIIFSTVDKQSGIDHYEVLEIKQDEVVGVEPENGWLGFLSAKEARIPNWKVAEIPYLLEDQTLQSVIKVRAIDKAGNIRQVEFVPSEKSVKEKSITSRLSLFVLSLVVVIFLLFILIIFIKRRRNIIK